MDQETIQVIYRSRTGRALGLSHTLRSEGRAKKPPCRKPEQKGASLSTPGTPTKSSQEGRGRTRTFFEVTTMNLPAEFASIEDQILSNRPMRSARDWL